MCSEILNNDGVIALAGVVVGFLLSEGSSAYKKCKERKDSKDALFDEVRFNHEQTINKIDILDQAINVLKKSDFSRRSARNIQPLSLRVSIMLRFRSLALWKKTICVTSTAFT